MNVKDDRETGRRQIDGQQHIANMNVMFESEFTFPKKHCKSEWHLKFA